jgi:hypothetical protein
MKKEAVEAARAAMQSAVFRILLVSVPCLALASCESSPSGRVQMDRGNGLGAESFAINMHGPSCPVEAVKRQLNGLVVIAIDVDPKGVVERTEVLSSPDVSLSETALASTTRTSFRMPVIDTSGQPSFGTGRLFFYFKCSTSPFKALLPSDLLHTHVEVSKQR